MYSVPTPKPGPGGLPTPRAGVSRARPNFWRPLLMKLRPANSWRRRGMVAPVALGVSHDLAFLVDLGAKAFDTV